MCSQTRFTWVLLFWAKTQSLPYTLTLEKYIINNLDVSVLLCKAYVAMLIVMAWFSNVPQDSHLECLWMELVGSNGVIRKLVLIPWWAPSLHLFYRHLLDDMLSTRSIKQFLGLTLNKFIILFLDINISRVVQSKG